MAAHLELGGQGLARPGQHWADQLHVWADGPEPLCRPVSRHDVHHQPPALLGRQSVKAVPLAAVHRVCQEPYTLLNLLDSQMKRSKCYWRCCKACQACRWPLWRLVKA